MSWVTGGANGVGLAVCLKLAEAGAACAIVDLNRAAAEAAVSAIEAAGGRAVIAIGDHHDSVRGNRRPRNFVREVVASALWSGQ